MHPMDAEGKRRMRTGQERLEKWVLDFWDFQREWASAEDIVPGLDVVGLAKANGAREGTPFFLSPDGRADWRVNSFWRAPGVRSLGVETQRRYAFSLKVWLDFLQAVGTPWDRATRNEFAAFKEWRLSAELNPDPLEPGSFTVDRAAVRRFYEWAAVEFDISNPIDVRYVEATSFRPAGVDVVGTPGGICKADVKWLTPAAFRQWRTIGIQGFTAEGLPDDRWKGRTEDWDGAFVEGLYGTGLRVGEWSSQLTIELPVDNGKGLFRGKLAAACAKRKIGRSFWARRRVAQQVRFYLEEGDRPAAIAQAQATGRYERVRDRWILTRVRANRVIEVVGETGRPRKVSLDSMTPSLRMRLFREGPGRLEPAWLWLNHDGTPRPKKTWEKTFERANGRVAKALGQEGAAGRLWARPHMLRHSLALRWFTIATFVAWQRTATLTKAEQRDFRNQLGDVWFLLAALLGPRWTELRSHRLHVR